MKRQLWGELSEQPDEATMAKQIEIDQDIMIDKRGLFGKYFCFSSPKIKFPGELKILHSSVFFEPKEIHIKLLSRNQSVNQIIGLKQKQEMLDELIETSVSDQYQFQQLVPTLKESLEAIPTHIPTPKHNDKFNKLCFIPPIPTNFTTGKPKEVQKVNKTCVQLALKKSICGLTRITDYSEVSESALTMFTDAVDHFFKSLMESIVTVLTNEDRETETDVDLMTFERAYFALTSESSTTFFNYFKKDIHDKHQQTVASFANKISELKSIVDSQQSLINEMQQPDFYQGFFVKEEIKQEEFDDYGT